MTAGHFIVIMICALVLVLIIDAFHRNGKRLRTEKYMPSGNTTTDAEGQTPRNLLQSICA